MKISELEVLKKLGLIPKYLVDGWRERQSDCKFTNEQGAPNPIESMPKMGSYLFHVLASLSLWTILSVFFGGMGILFASKHALGAFGMMVITLFAIGGCGIITLMVAASWWREKPYVVFAKDLDLLVPKVEGGLAMILSSNRSTMREIARRFLCWKAEFVDQSECHYGRVSREADDARVEFKSWHKAFLNFDLVEKNWDVYFQTLEPIKPVVSGGMTEL